MSKTFEKALTTIFEAVEPEFRKRTVEHYRNVAKQQHASWVERLKQPEPARSMLYFDLTSPPKYSIIKAKDSRTPAYAGTWAQKQQANWQCDLKVAEKDADRSVDQAKAHFVSKLTAKLTNATKLRKDKPTLTGKLQFNGIVVEGDLYVEYKCGDYFRMTMQIITNYRNGMSYYQFPARFKDVGFGPKPARLLPHGPYSEAWLAKNFSTTVKAFVKPEPKPGRICPFAVGDKVKVDLPNGFIGTGVVERILRNKLIRVTIKGSAFRVVREAHVTKE